MNETKQKMAKTSKVVALVLKISFILVAVAMGILLIGMGFLAFSSGNLSQSLQQTLSGAVQGTSSTIEQGASAINIAVSNLIIVFGLGVIALFPIFMVFYTLHRLFADVSKNQTPFTTTNAKIMKRVALWTVIMCLVDFIVNGVSDKLLIGEVTFTLNFIWLVLAAAIYCIALVFDYGTQLQQQSDETL